MYNTAVGDYRVEVGGMLVPVQKILKSLSGRKDFQWDTIWENYRAVCNEGINMAIQTKV